jgi:WD40 repeat protein
VDLAVKLWNVDTGKATKTLTGHKRDVRSVDWSSDDERVVSGSRDTTFRVWDVESGETILGPINAGIDNVDAVRYSLDDKMIVTGGKMGLKFWDANTGELLKTFQITHIMCLAWTLDGKTLFVGESKIDTATWTVLSKRKNLADTISLSPNGRILASTIYMDKIAQLWNVEINQPIGTPLHHERIVRSVTFSADGKFLITSCQGGYIYTWDVSAIVKEVGLPSDILLSQVDVTLQRAQKIKGTRQIPPGFFNDALREANLHTRLSQSNGPSNFPTPPSHERTHGRFSSFWRRFEPHRAGRRDNQPRSQPLSWTRNIVSGMMRRPDRSDIEMREPPVVEVPYAPGKPRNYHVRKKKQATSSSQFPNTHNTQQPSAATQSTPSSLQQPPPTTTASTPAIVGTAGTTETISHPHITGSGWRVRFVGWLCCIPVQNLNGQP